MKGINKVKKKNSTEDVGRHNATNNISQKRDISNGIARI